MTNETKETKNPYRFWTWKNPAIQFEAYLLAMGIVCTGLAYFNIFIDEPVRGYFLFPSFNRRQVWGELMPYVENQDSLPGVSFSDQLDFAKRAGIPSSRVIEGNGFRIGNYNLNELERALKSYKNQEKKEELNKKLEYFFP